MNPIFDEIDENLEKKTDQNFKEPKNSEIESNLETDIPVRDCKTKRCENLDKLRQKRLRILKIAEINPEHFEIVEAIDEEIAILERSLRPEKKVKFFTKYLDQKFIWNSRTGKIIFEDGVIYDELDLEFFSGRKRSREEVKIVHEMKKLFPNAKRKRYSENFNFAKWEQVEKNRGQLVLGGNRNA